MCWGAGGQPDRVRFIIKILVFGEGTAVLMLLHLVAVLMRYRWDRRCRNCFKMVISAVVEEPL